MKLKISFILILVAIANFGLTTPEKNRQTDFQEVLTSVEPTTRNYIKTYAVIVAIADYKFGRQGTGDLTYPINDAIKFYQQLTKSPHHRVPAANVVLLKDKEATKKGILAALKTTFAKAGNHDRIIFYYSGHGELNQLIPYEASPQRTDDRILYREIKQIFKECPANSKICFIDACFANSIKSKATNTRASKQLKAEMSESDIVVMVSSQSFQTSIEYKALKQGVFSYFLLKGMKGSADRDRDGEITIAELHKYVYKNVKVYTRNKQTPHTFGKFNKNMPIVYLH